MTTAPRQITAQLLTEGLLFGEAPRYHAGLLYISDMIGKVIYTIDPGTGDKKVFREVEQQPNGMVFTADGSLIWSSMFDSKLYIRDKSGKDTLYADMNGMMKGYCGDMSIDSSGRVFLDDTGSRVLHGEEPRPGRILMVEKDGSITVAAENLIFPNALFIDNKGEKLYCAETYGYGMFRWDIDSRGQLSNREKVWTPTTIAPNGEVGDTALGLVGIDGGCMDSEDGMWLSMLGLEKFIRLDQNGRVTDEIKVSGHATACALGGSDGKTIFLVTNSFQSNDETIFSAMMGKRTKCTISKARVNVAKGMARP